LKRRDFLKRTTASGFALALPAIGRPGILEEQLLVGCVGTGGMGWKDRQRISKNPQVRIIALCDVDRDLLGRASKEVPGARAYTDWRELLEQKEIDAVTVSIPDHMHAPVIFTALEQGKHVYGQKPLTHSVHEARQIGISARKAGVVTQMGMQVHSTVAYRGIVKTIQAGVIGKVRAVHSWSDRPVWPQGPALKRPTKSHPVPEHFDWNSWLGVAPKRPFVRELYHPGKWRGWVDFGSGALGDMGCHILDPVVWSLQLGAPSAIRSELHRRSGRRGRRRPRPTRARASFTIPFPAPSSPPATPSTLAGMTVANGRHRSLRPCLRARTFTPTVLSSLARREFCIIFTTVTSETTRSFRRETSAVTRSRISNHTTTGSSGQGLALERTTQARLSTTRPL
jgi:predicted dehydrogenase